MYNNSATDPNRKKFVESVASKNYKGPSVTDYLTLSGYDPSQSSRKQLAMDYNVSNYDFSGDANTRLMSALRGGGTAPGNTQTTGTNTDTSTTSTVDPNFQAYLDALKETDEEKNAREYVSRLLTDSKSAYEKALQTGETMGFAQGEAARVKRNNDLTIGSASDAYDVLKGGAENRKNVAKLKYDYYAGKTKAEEEANKPFELSEGQSRYVYNPKTKSYDVVANVPKTYKPTTPGVKPPTQTQQRNSDVSTVVDVLEKAKTAKNQFGIDPTSYQFYLDQILEQYGSAGANELKRQLAAKGLKIDNAQDPKNYK